MHKGVQDVQFFGVVEHNRSQGGAVDAAVTADYIFAEGFGETLFEGRVAVHYAAGAQVAVVDLVAEGTQHIADYGLARAYPSRYRCKPAHRFSMIYSAESTARYAFTIPPDWLRLRPMTRRSGLPEARVL